MTDAQFDAVVSGRRGNGSRPVANCKRDHRILSFRSTGLVKTRLSAACLRFFRAHLLEPFAQCIWKSGFDFRCDQTH